MPSDVELVRSYSEPFGSVNVATIDWRADAMREVLANVYAEDVELRPLESGAGLGIKESYSGIDGVADYLATWFEPFDEYQVEWLDFIDAGGFVLVPSRQRGTGGASGARSELELTYLYELRDGKVVKAYQYDTLEQAREAAAKLPEA